MACHGHPQAWARGALAPWKCLKVVFLLQMLSKTSVDEVFMQKMSLGSGGFAPDPHRVAVPGPWWGTSVLQTPHCPPLETILWGPMGLDSSRIQGAGAPNRLTEQSLTFHPSICEYSTFISFAKRLCFYLKV